MLGCRQAQLLSSCTRQAAQLSVPLRAQVPPAGRANRDQQPTPRHGCVSSGLTSSSAVPSDDSSLADSLELGRLDARALASSCAGSWGASIRAWAWASGATTGGAVGGPPKLLADSTVALMSPMACARGARSTMTPGVEHGHRSQSPPSHMLLHVRSRVQCSSRFILMTT